MSKNISIIGCGWLGLPLAKHLIEDHYTIKGSSTSVEKITHLKSVGIDAFYVELTDEGIKGDIEKCLSESEILILNIPPGLRKHPERDFVKQMRLLVPKIESSFIKNIIFISSTSVFRDEESIPIITEDTIPNPDSEVGKQLLEVEGLFQNNSHFKTTILRFSGLFGADRYPANHLSGKTNLKNPNAPVNLIHLDDCIGIIRSIINQDIWDETFNISTTPHPSRQDYYASVCKALNMSLPKFDDSISSKGKIINSRKLIESLGYQFQVKL